MGGMYYWRDNLPECFTLFSFWLGRDSDALLEWPPAEPTPDFTFAYLEQD